MGSMFGMAQNTKEWRHDFIANDCKAPCLFIFRHLMSAAKENNVMETNNPVKVLGLVWDAKLDLIFPSPKPESTNFTSARTKRAILKCASSIFDPLGLCVTTSAKLFIQQLWQSRPRYNAVIPSKVCYHTTQY